MLGRTADALSAYMGSVVLAEVGRNEDTEWVIFGRAIGEDEEIEKDILHVQMGGPGTKVLGQQGGLNATSERFDCAFLWAVEITDDPDDRFVRLDQDGEVFDAASELSTLLPFSLEEPEVDLEEEDTSEDDESNDEDDEDDDPNSEDTASNPSGRPPSIH